MYAHIDRLHHESLDQAIARWAGHAAPHLLTVILTSGGLGALGLFLIDPARWPVALGMIAFASLGGWGLAEHRLMVRHTCRMAVIEWAMALVGALAALVALFTAFFWLMGPAPHI